MTDLCLGSAVKLQIQEWRESEIYGPGFMTSLPCNTQLVVGQAVFVTHNGREVEGTVVQHLRAQVGQQLFLSLISLYSMLVKRKHKIDIE